MDHDRKAPGHREIIDIAPFLGKDVLSNIIEQILNKR
jgi:hypothetical protein